MNNIQRKIPCLYEHQIVEKDSCKRQNQSFSVVASENIRIDALNSKIDNAIVSEKIDGTCVLIREYCAKPTLWARLDRKPNKSAAKKFKSYIKSLKEEQSNEFKWNIERDMRIMPDEWVPADEVEICDEIPQPDENGHTPGWLPIETSRSQYCWHFTTVDLNASLGVFLLQNDKDCESELKLCVLPLSSFMNRTLELIGTNVNGNPYNLGNKENPFHVMIPHGEITFHCPPPPVSLDSLKIWFNELESSNVEGIVWKCGNGNYFKIHRHHLGLQWPINSTALTNKSVVVVFANEDLMLENTITHNSLKCLHGIRSRTYTSLRDVILTK